MFRARLSEPRVLKSSMEAISNMIDEASLVGDEQGLKLRAMDPAHVAMVDFMLKSEVFDEYSIDLKNQSFLKIGLDLTRFFTILKRAGASDTICLELTKDGTALRIRFEGESSTRTFSMPLIELAEEELKVPTLDFPCKVEISPRILQEAIKDAEIVSDHVVFNMDAENFYISARGELGDVEVRVSKGEAVSFSCDENARSMFSIEYLKDISRASDLAESVKVYLGNNIPVKLEFIAVGVDLSFLLAPRIESE